MNDRLKDIRRTQDSERDHNICPKWETEIKKGNKKGKWFEVLPNSQESCQENGWKMNTASIFLLNIFRKKIGKMVRIHRITPKEKLFDE